MFIRFKDMQKLLLGSSIMGLVLVYFAAISMDAEEMNLYEIDYGHVGKYVKTCGIVENNFIGKEGDLFFDLTDTAIKESVSVVFFRNSFQQTELSKIQENAPICLEGFVATHNGNLELIGKKII